MEINERLGNLTPAVSKTPEPIVTKFGMGDEVRDPYHYAKFYYDPIRGFCSLPPPRRGTYKVTQLVFLGSSVSLQPRPLHRFSRSIRQMTSIRARMCLLASQKQNFTFQPHSPPKKTQIFDLT